MKAMKTVDDQEIDFILAFIQSLKINLDNSWYLQNMEFLKVEFFHQFFSIMQPTS